MKRPNSWCKLLIVKKKTLQRPGTAAKSRAATKPAARQKMITRPKNSKQFDSLPEAQREIWNRVVHVIAKMRSEGASLTKASREFGLNPKTVKTRAGTALRKTKSGRYVPRPSDKLLRVLVIPDPQGQREVVVKDSIVASKIAEYSDAVQKFLRTGDSSRLKKFRRIRLLEENGQRIKLVTDLAELQRLGSAGVLSFESLYTR